MILSHFFKFSEKISKTNRIFVQSFHKSQFKFEIGNLKTKQEKKRFQRPVSHKQKFSVTSI